MSFKQKSHDFLQINPTEDRVEYAQLKRYDDSIPTQQTTSDMKNYSTVGTSTINIHIVIHCFSDQVYAHANK